MYSKEELLAYFSDIMCEKKDICGLVSENSSEYLFDILSRIEESPITKVQFDQLLALQNLKTMSDDFFKFYWLEIPKVHFYQIEAFEIRSDIDAITSLKQLKWGLNRLFIDSLYIYGNIQKGYEELCSLNSKELSSVFSMHIFDTVQIKTRGNTLHFEDISREDRYLISEMACKTFDNLRNRKELTEMLIESYKNAISQGVDHPSFRSLLDGDYIEKEKYEQLSLFPEYCLSEVMENRIISEDDIIEKAEDLANRFTEAHRKARTNTELYLSLVSDLDVYVATSMRTKDHFMNMSSFCEHIFKSDKLKEYNLRYFDPTISAADSHEDKGLIECLMVKSARMLIYHTGDRDSYGKDVEAAMALCLGKPTIFYCSNEKGKAEFYKKVHPLSRLVNFSNGVAGGVIACVNEDEVTNIVYRLITNTMKYRIKRKEGNADYYLLEEEMTDSVVRVQTDNELLTSVFWNNYHI